MNKKKIFIADDDESCLYLKKSLISHGFEVEATQNSKEAMLMINAFKPDLVLLDLLMPGLGGLEICEMLNHDEKTRDVPVIVISGLKSFVDIKKTYKSGVVSYITKPFKLEDLLKEITRFLAYKENCSE